MTAPVWMASPPEVHSALLSSGPGPGSLLAAAAAWHALSTEYASAAEEVTALLATVQSDSWQGPSAESYVAAHAPYLAWLLQTSTNSAAAAAQHETVAAAYIAALAAMPTLAELAANHAIHAVLLATNFFGINTIPIAVNEADYARMWVQAATTMTTYQAVADAAVVSSPQTQPAPEIQKAASAAAAQTGTQSEGLGDILESLADRLGLAEIVDKFAIDHIFDFLNNPVGYTEQVIQQAIQRFIENPVAAIINPLYLFFDGDEVFYGMGYAFLPASVGSVVIGPVASVSAVAGLPGLAADIEPAATPAVAPVPTTVAAAPNVLPVAEVSPAPAQPAVAATSAPAPAAASTTATAASAPAPTAGPPSAGGAGFGYPYVVGPPGIDLGSGISASASAKSKAKDPFSAAASAPAAAAARERVRGLRRQRAKLRDYGDEFMEMNVEVDPDWNAPTAASIQGAGPLGFAGTAAKDAVNKAAGLATLDDEGFGGGPSMPMMPGTLAAERPLGDQHQ